jgi:hypothetical protein
VLVSVGAEVKVEET